ncbi:hypothetical protein D3C87_1204210 [compost metagenome]
MHLKLVGKMGKEKDNKCTDNSLAGAKIVLYPSEGIGDIGMEKLKEMAERNKDKSILFEYNEIQESFAQRMQEVREEEKQKIVDAFAGQVLQGMTAGFYSMDYAHGWKPEDIAKECYDIAEAMYKERSRRNG